MKYYNPQVIIPWYDGDMKHWMRMQFNGVVDKRRLKREVRKLCQRSFGTQVNDHFLKYDCQYLLTTVNQLLTQIYSSALIDKQTDRLMDILQQEHNQIEAEQAAANQGIKTDNP